MDRLIEDYERALAEEFILRDLADRFQGHVRNIEMEARCRQIVDDPQMPQWQVIEIVSFALNQEQRYHDFKKALKEAQDKHGKAKIRLAVVTERLKLTRARLYGGRNEVLDMQEVETTPDNDLA